jgi:hypothetical protein
VLTLLTGRRLNNVQTITLDTFPEDMGILCSGLTGDSNLIVGTSDAVYFYQTEEKGICFGEKGSKKQIMWFDSYLAVVSEAKSNSKVPRDTVTVYDLKNKFIAFSSAFERVSSLVYQWNTVFVGTESGQLTRLTEMDLSSKLDILFRKNLFSIAIAVASTRECDEKLIMEIYQMYGDHLYEKCDYTNAMEQYLQAIEYVEPSYVIRRFLDARRINNLTKYLEALHTHGNGDHTTLLLNCYTKLKDVRKMDQFVKTKSSFDVVRAIRVCRKSGYYQHALTLASRHKNHQAYVAIQIEDLKEVSVALEFIRSLEFDYCKSFLVEYGTALLEHACEETVALMIALCVDYTPREMDVSEAKDADGDAIISNNSNPGRDYDDNRSRRQRALPEELIHLLVENPGKLLFFLEEVSRQVECSAAVYNTMLELYLRAGDPSSSSSTASTSSSTSSSSAALTPSGVPLEGKHVAPAQNANAHKIMNLLKAQPARYDVNHALVLTRMYDFEKGILYLCGKLQLYNEIVQHHMDRAQHGKVIKACKKFSDMDKQLWVNALVYFARKKTPCEAEIIQVLDNVDRLHLLPPLIVVQILASSENAKPLTVVKDYIVRTLQREQGTIRTDMKEISRLEQESSSMRNEISALRTSVTTFQEINCHHCGLQLQLPAVHFLCMHSYHQHCIVDNDKECPECAPECNKVMEIKESLKTSAQEHDRFFKQLKESKDSFATVAEYFGRGQ